MARARNDNSARQNNIQKGLFAFVLVICLGLLMVPSPQADRRAEVKAAISAGPEAELGYGASRTAAGGLQP